jgi:pimeloyl-ACP methyl ester carboxylesterase
VFVPLALALRISQPSVKLVSRLTRLIPRSHFLVDVLIDFARRDPKASLAVLDGLTFGRVAPPRAERRKITAPILTIGHTRDPVHPFSDADTLTRDLPGTRLVQATSIFEWRLRPSRLDDALCTFLDEVWAEPLASAGDSLAAR